MIEVLTAMTLISIVIFPLISDELSVTKISRASMYQTIALNQMNNLADILNAQYVLPDFDKKLLLWQQDNGRLLPQGKGDYSLFSTHVCQIRLHWFYYHMYHEKLMVSC